MRPSVTEAQLYSSTQNSNIINTKQDYTSEEKDNLLKSHNTLSYKKTSNKWEIAKYKDYKSLSPAISYGVDVFKSTVSLPGYLNKKVPFTLAFAYKNERYFPQGNIIVAPGIQLPYVQYSSEVEETVSLFDELKDPKSVAEEYIKSLEDSVLSDVAMANKAEIIGDFVSLINYEIDSNIPF